MTPRTCRFARAIGLAFFPALLWVLLPLPGGAIARGVETGTPDRRIVDNVPRERLER
jgi:hypothetical protein